MRRQRRQKNIKIYTDTFIGGMRRAFDELTEATISWSQVGYNAVKSFVDSGSQLFRDIFAAGIRLDLKGLGDAFKSFGKRVLNLWLDLLAQIASAWAMKGIGNLLKGAFGGGSPGGLWSQIIGGLTGAGGGGGTGGGGGGVGGLIGKGAGAVGKLLGLGGGGAAAASASAGGGVFAGLGSIGAGGAAGGATGAAGTAGLGPVSAGGFGAKLSAFAANPGLAGTLGVVGAFYGAAGLIGKAFRSIKGETHPGVAKAASMNLSALAKISDDLIFGRKTVKQALATKIPAYTYMFDSGLIKQTGTQESQKAVQRAVGLITDEIKATSAGATMTGRWRTALDVFPHADPVLLAMVPSRTPAPGLQEGGVVKKTGLAVVHEGETFSGTNSFDRPMNVHVHVEIDRRELGYAVARITRDSPEVVQGIQKIVFPTYRRLATT
jgi:hypothetical protein